MSAPSPIPGVAARFALIVDALCRVLAARMVKNPAILPLLMLAWTRLRRASARFACLAARADAGLPPPPPRPARLRHHQPQARRRLPRGRAWLIRLLPDTASIASQLQYLLDEPATAALLAAAPGIGRILRPLCRALAVRPTPTLPAPPPRPAPRPATKPARMSPVIADAEPRRRRPPRAGLASFTLPKAARGRP